MNEGKNIDYRFKILYALGTVMVVCGHAGGGGISIAKDWFPYEGVHLALFVFSSGYFYKQSSDEEVGKYIVKKIKTLIVPLYIYTIIYGIIVQVLRHVGFEMGGDFTLSNILIMPIMNGHQFIYNMGGWFIAPLFMVEVYNILIRKIFRILQFNVSEKSFFCLNIVLGLIGNQLACMGYLSGWWLVLIRMLYFLPFYELGIFYKKVLEKYDRRVDGVWYFSFIFIAKLLIVCFYGKMPTYTASWCHDFTEGPLMPIIIGYLGIAFWLRIATVVEPVIGKNKYINFVADNTYSIMMNQFLGFMVVKTMYALFDKYTVLVNDFDWTNYKTNIWWYHFPKGVYQTAILYVVAGIIVPIMIQKLVNVVKKGMRLKRLR